MTELAIRLGPVGADKLMSRALEELAVQLAKAHRSFLRSNMNEMRASAGKVAEVSDHIGLASLSLIAQHVCELATANDSTALAAVVARLTRVGELSLMQVWELEDLSV
ncbi:MAG: hypothetical protein KUG69_01300 [Marinosulfonomonas sp.]|nr:hypothetical protein [Marinosulfonomonas sp.]